jgi:hypothetical protein
MRELIAAQPFSSVTLDEFNMDKTPSTHDYTYRGLATKSAEETRT